MHGCAFFFQRQNRLEGGNRSERVQRYEERCAPAPRHDRVDEGGAAAPLWLASGLRATDAGQHATRRPFGTADRCIDLMREPANKNGFSEVYLAVGKGAMAAQAIRWAEEAAAPGQSLTHHQHLFHTVSPLDRLSSIKV